MVLPSQLPEELIRIVREEGEQVTDFLSLVSGAA